MQPIFRAILEPAETLAGHLSADPALTRERAAADELVTAIPHQLYVGDTPLHLAAAATRLAAVKALLAAGAAPDAVNRRGASPLHYACDPRPNTGQWSTADQAQIVAALVGAGADVNARDRDGTTPLHRAVRARSPAAVRALLEAGADVAAVNGKGSTPLQLAKASTGASGTAGARAEQREIIDLLTAAAGG